MSITEKQSLVTPQSCSGENTSNRRKKNKAFFKRFELFNLWSQVQLCLFDFKKPCAMA